MYCFHNNHILKNSSLFFIPASDDWLTEEYENIRKKQTLVTLQLKLDKIKKRKDLFEQMKIRVSKVKNKSTNKNIEFYFNKTDISKKVEDEKKNVLEEKVEMEEDRDLILEECEEKGDADSEGEETVEDDDSQITKVRLTF